MSTLRIRRQRCNVADPKKILRAHIDQLPLEKQRDFVLTALQLIAERTNLQQDMSIGGYHPIRQDIKH
jgi:hypothetical protein